MQFTTLILGASAALLAGVSAQSNEVPPPSCLQTCMDNTGNCNLCTDEGKSQVNGCITSTCGYRDVSYAEAYFGSVCTNGGYDSYQTSPPTFVKVPDSSCSNSTSKRETMVLLERTFQA